jgi:hypothetical protein
MNRISQTIGAIVLGAAAYGTAAADESKAQPIAAQPAAVNPIKSEQGTYNSKGALEKLSYINGVLAGVAKDGKISPDAEKGLSEIETILVSLGRLEELKKDKLIVKHKLTGAVDEAIKMTGGYLTLVAENTKGYLLVISQRSHPNAKGRMVGHKPGQHYELEGRLGKTDENAGLAPALGFTAREALGSYQLGSDWGYANPTAAQVRELEAGIVVPEEAKLPKKGKKADGKKDDAAGSTGTDSGKTDAGKTNGTTGADEGAGTTGSTDGASGKTDGDSGKTDDLPDPAAHGAGNLEGK